MTCQNVRNASFCLLVIIQQILSIIKKISWHILEKAGFDACMELSVSVWKLSIMWKLEIFKHIISRNDEIWTEYSN